MLPLHRLLHHQHQHQARSHYSGYLCSGPGNGSLGAGLELPDINYDVIKRELTPILGCRWDTVEIVCAGQTQQCTQSGAFMAPSSLQSLKTYHLVR